MQNNNDKDEDNKDDNEDKVGATAAAVAGSIVVGGSVSSGDHGGVGDGGFGRWRVVAVFGVVICRTTTAMGCVHNNQPEEGCAAKISATEGKLQATTSRRNERMQGRHNTNTSATTVSWPWQQWWQQWQQTQW
jgi:hypothetical protein